MRNARTSVQECWDGMACSQPSQQLLPLLLVLKAPFASCIAPSHVRCCVCVPIRAKQASQHVPAICGDGDEICPLCGLEELCYPRGYVSMS